MTLFYIVKNVNEPIVHFFSSFSCNISFSSSYYYYLNRDLLYLKYNYVKISYYSKIIQPYSMLDRIHPITKKTTKKNYMMYYELLDIFYTYKIKFIKSSYNNFSFSSSPILSSSPVLTMLEEGYLTSCSFLTFTKNPYCIKEFILKKTININNTICHNIFSQEEIINILKNKFKQKFDVLIFELFNNDYKKETLPFCLIIILYFIFFHQEQSAQSMFIFKIKNLNPILCQFIYILSYIFDSCCIVKSSIYDKYKNEKYIICKRLNNNVEVFQQNKKQMLYIILNKVNIYSLLQKSPPLYFMNILNEINILFGQDQLFFLEQLIQLYQSPNLNDKIKILQKNNLDKCNQFIQNVCL